MQRYRSAFIIQEELFSNMKTMSQVSWSRPWFHYAHHFEIGFSTSSFLSHSAAAGRGPVHDWALAVASISIPDIPRSTAIATSTSSDNHPSRTGGQSARRRDTSAGDRLRLLTTESFLDPLIHQRLKGALRVPWDYQWEKGDEDEKETQCRLHTVESNTSRRPFPELSGEWICS